jgi:hypothetical protein
MLLTWNFCIDIGPCAQSDGQGCEFSNPDRALIAARWPMTGK